MISLISLSLLISAILLFIVNSNHMVPSPSSSNSSDKLDDATNRDTFDYEQAAEISAMRWLAMAKFYEAQGLLTRDDFDYEEAADLMAYRWQAMAQAYQRMGSLNYKTSNAQPGPDWFRVLFKGTVLNEIPTP